MSDFVEQCRREWKRLGVPAAAADDMASELVADLEAAAAEGAFAPDLLGSDASDPRAFAASWAAERGVVPSRAPRVAPEKKSIAFAIAALLSVAAIAAGAALLTAADERSSALSRPLSVWVADRGVHPLANPTPVALSSAVFSPDGRWVAVAVDQDANAASDSSRTLAWSLLIAGLVAFALSSLSWFQVSRRTS